MSEGLAVDEVRPGDAASAGRVIRWGWALIAVGAFWRIWAVSGSWFWQDDVIHVWQAANQPYSEFVRLAWNGHLEPASWTVYWIVTELAPQSWTGPFLVICAVQVLTYVVFWRLLTAMFRPQSLLLIPLGLFVFGTTSLTALLWFATSLEISAVVLCLVLTCLAVARFGLGGGPRFLVLAVLWFAIGLLFQERALIIPPFLVLLVMAAFTNGGVRQRIAAAWRFSRSLWVAFGVVGAGYLWLAYLPHSGVRDQVGDSLPLPDLVNAAWLAIAETLIPTSLGGNWAPPIDRSTIAPRPATGMLLVCWVVVLGFLALAWRRRRNATVWALVLVGGVAALELLALFAARLDFIGILAARDPRYVTFTSVATAIGCALAMLPVRGSPNQTSILPLRAFGRSASPAAVAGVTVALLAVSSFPSLLYTADAIHDRGTRGWISTARQQSLDNPGVTFADTRVPDDVIGSIFPEYQWASVALQVGADQPVFNRTSQRVKAFDGLGKARAATLIDVEAKAPPGPVAGCGYRVSDQLVRIPLGATVGGQRSGVRLAYFSQRETDVRVTAGTVDDTVRLVAGLDELWVFPGTAIDSVAIRTTEPGQLLCVTEAKLGTPWPEG